MWFNSSLVFHLKLCRSLVRTVFLCFQNASKTIENFNKRYEDNVELCMEQSQGSHHFLCFTFRSALNRHQFVRNNPKICLILDKLFSTTMFKNSYENRNIACPTNFFNSIAIYSLFAWKNQRLFA